jgi:hypothetical protein
MIARVDSSCDSPHAPNDLMLGTWWGYAVADRAVVGVLTIILLVGALGYVLVRYVDHRRTRR